MKIIDLSTTIANDIPVEPPHQIPRIKYITHKDSLSLETMRKYFPEITWDDLPDGEGWAAEILEIRTHSGTHMDAPWHYHSTMNNGEPSWTIDQVPLELCIGDGVVVDFSDKPDGYVCTSGDFIEYFNKINYILKPLDIVLIHTSAPTVWGTSEYLKKGCGVGSEATLWLCDKGIRTVGTDAWSWDAPLSLVWEKYKDNKDPSIIWEGHKAGRSRSYMHMEKLTNLDKLPPYGFKVIAFPIKIEDASAGWVRPVAILD